MIVVLIASPAEADQDEEHQIHDLIGDALEGAEDDRRGIERYAAANRERPDRRYYHRGAVVGGAGDEKTARVVAGVAGDVDERQHTDKMQYEEVQEPPARWLGV